MSIKYYDKSGATPEEKLLAGISPVDAILSSTSKNAIQNKAVYNALRDKLEATTTDLINYYLKSDVYNKSEVRALIGAVETLTMEVVSSLPVSDISTTTIYLLKQSGSSIYDEYVYINDAWVKIGTTDLDLSGYMLTADFNVAIADYFTKAEINNMLNSYYTKTEIDTNFYDKDAVDDLLDAKQDALTFDTTPTAGSSNPVTSDGIKDAIDDTAADIYKVMGKNGAKNLLAYPYPNSTGTIGGVSFVDNGDGSVTVNGTASSGVGFRLALYTSHELEAGRYILSVPQVNNTINIAVNVLSDGTSERTIDQCGKTKASFEFDLDYSDYDYVKILIWVPAGTTVDNIIIKPMLRLASDTDPTYQPYAMTNQQMTSKLIGLADNVNKNGSKNLLRITKATSTVYGVTFTVYDDGHIRVNGTANNPNDTGCNFVFSYVNTEHEIPKGRYTLSCDGLPHSNTFQCVIDAGDSAYQYVKRIAYIASASLTTFDVDYNGYACFYAFLHVGNGTTVNNVDVYPMLRLASDPDDTHVPFAMSNRELTDVIHRTVVLSSTFGNGNFYYHKCGRMVSVYFDFTLSTDASNIKLSDIPLGFRPAYDFTMSTMPHGELSYVPAGAFSFRSSGAVNIYMGQSGKRYFSAISYISEY